MKKSDFVIKDPVVSKFSFRTQILIGQILIKVSEVKSNYSHSNLFEGRFLIITLVFFTPAADSTLCKATLWEWNIAWREFSSQPE